MYGVVVRFSPEGGCFPRNHFKRSVSARFIAYEASSHRTSPRGSSWVQALPGKFRGNHNPGFDRGNFCPFPGAYLGSHTPGIPGISGSTWEHTHPGAYSGRETRVFPGGRWEPRSQPRSWPRKNPGTGWIPGFSRVVLLGVAGSGSSDIRRICLFKRFYLAGVPRPVVVVGSGAIDAPRGYGHRDHLSRWDT